MRTGHNKETSGINIAPVAVNPAPTKTPTIPTFVELLRSKIGDSRFIASSLATDSAASNVREVVLVSAAPHIPQYNVSSELIVEQ